MAHGLRAPRGKQATASLVGVARPKPVGVTPRLRSALLLGTALQASTLLLLAVPARAQPAANARPTGGIVTAGSASIGTSASTTTITQSTQRTAINWQSFDVGSQQTVDFIQPSSSSVALNRVISSNPSQIAGRIDANGQIILINQSGVIFDQGAQVNTAGLIVSAAGMNNVNFMAGKLVFDQAAHPNAAVVNQGSLTVRQAGLVAPQVANSGVITAKLGHVVLAGAKTATLDLYGDGLVALDMNNQVTQAPIGPGGAPVAALVTNTGVIQADGGTVQLTAREADGLVQNLVQAGGKISADSVGSKTGMVVLGGLGGSIVMSGVVTADGTAPGSSGGQVQVDASQGVALAAASRISASGPAGGGTVAIGTTLARAKGGPGTASTLTAQTVQVSQGASIATDATANGNGGHVTVLSSLSTSMAGNISARGGPKGGNGGFIETSGPVLSIGDMAVVSAAAPHGIAGTWLLDPWDTVISTDATKAVAISVAGTTQTFRATDTVATVNNQQLEGVLDGGTNVSINTGTNGTEAGNLTVNAIVTWTTPTSLSLNAAGNIVINLPLQGTNAGSSLALNAGGTVTQASTGPIAVGILTGNSVGGATLNQNNTVNTLGPWNDSGPNNATGLSFNNTQAFQTAGLVTSTGPVLLTTTAGGVTVNGTVSSSNSVTITATGALDIPGIVNSPIVALTGNTLSITGEVTDGGNGLTIFAATGGGITETNGTLIAGTLEGSSIGSVSLGTSSTNTIARLDGFDVSSATGTFVLTDIIGLSIFGAVAGPAGVYIESAGATGIQIINAKARVTAGAGANVSFQADAFSITGGAQVEGSSSQFELAPNTPNLGVTLGAVGTGLSLASLTGINPTSLRIGAVTLPTATTPTTFAGSITIGGNFGTGSNTLDLEAHGQVTENASGALSVGELTGTAASFTLTNLNNALSVINNLVATGGDIVVVNGQGLALMGTQRGNNLFYEVAETGSNLSLGTFEASLTFPAILTAAPGGRISLVQDDLTSIIGSTVTATNGTVELAPFSPINTSLAGFTGLAIDQPFLSIISTGTTGKLVVGGYTNVPASETTPTASAASVTIDGAVDLTGIAATLLLQSKGPITENAGPLTVGTLEASGTVITLNDTNNAINVLGDVTSTSFTLNDRLALTLTGDVIATTSASITDTVSLTQTGDLNSPAITLSAGSGGIALDAPSVLGQTGATVSLTSSGGVNQAAGATLVAGTLQTLTGGITGGPATFAGTTNAIATLGNFNVTGNTLSLSDTGTLTITGPVIATSVTIGGTAGSTPSTITADGSVAATNTLSITSGAGGITLNGGTTLTGQTINLDGGSGGISLIGNAVVGQANAVVDLTAGAGGVTEFDTSTIIAATLQGNVAGTVQLGNDNTVLTVGSFTVTGGTNSFDLQVSGDVAVTGPLTAPGNVGLGAIGTGSGNAITINGLVSAGGTLSASSGLGALALGTGAVLTAPTISLQADGIALTGNASVGGPGSVVELGSFGGFITEAATSTITAATLETTALGSLGAVSLLGTGNVIAGLGKFTVTGNAFSLSDTGPLAITGPVTATAVTIGGAAGSTPTSITLTGNLTAPTITLSAGGGGIALNGASVLGQGGALVDLNSLGGVNQTAGATLTAATLESTNGVSGGAATFAGTNNAIATLAGFTVIGNALSLSDTGPLTITGPVTASAVTIGGTAGSTPSTISTDSSIAATNTLSITAGAGGMTLNGGTTLTGQTINLDGGSGGISLIGNAVVGQANAVVDLTAGAGGVTEFNSSTIIAATLQGNVAGTVQLGNDNTVLTLGSFTVTGGTNSFDLQVSGDLAVTGPVTAPGDVGLGAIGTGSGNAITINGIVSAGGTLSAGSGLGALALGTGAVLTAPTIILQSDGIALTGNASVGEPGAVVELGSFGGFITEAATAALIAGTLQSPGGITGGAANFAGTNNAIATLGGFTVAGNPLSLSDTGPLAITGPVTATAVTIGGTAGSSPTGITLTGDLTAPTITLSAGGSGIALNGTSVLGQTGAVVDLNSSGGVNEVAGATLIAMTLASTDGVSGGAATFAGTSNAIGTLGGFTVTNGALTLSDTGILNITGSVTASAVTIGGTAGTTPTGITLTGGLAAATITLSAGNSGIALNGASVLGQSGALVDLTSTGGVAEVAGATLIAGTLQSTGGITGGAATFAGTTNAIAGLGKFTVTGNALSLSDTGPLTITGPVNVGLNLTIGGGLLSTPSSITLAANATVTAATTTSLTAGNGGITLLSGSLLNGGSLLDLTSAGGVSDNGKISATTLDGVISGGAANLAGANAISQIGDFTVIGNALILGDQNALGINGSITATAVTIGGTAGSTPLSINLASTGIIEAPAITLSGGSQGITLNGGSALGQAGATVDLSSQGGITEQAGATLTAATLQSSGGITGAATLTSTANAVSALGNISASTSFTLNDSTNLAVNAQLSSPHIALLDPGQTVTLANGATIVTGGTPPPSPPGPPALKEEPSNGGPGAFIEAASFTQVGSSTLTGLATAGPTLQISVTNTAQFDPPLGLEAPTGWLILNLGNGTAAGNVFVAALNVTYDVPGSTNLTGTIAGITDGAAARAGFIQPGININYLFNGCEIGAAVCVPVESLPPGEVPPFGPPDLVGVPVLAGLLPFQLLALPIATPACTSAAPATGEANAPEHTCALTDPDVVPPNVSYVDY